MLIGQISKGTGLSRDTIRFYEKKGLLTVDRSFSEFNNYKNYSNDHMKRLLLIKRAKKFGFTLTEIKELLELVDTKKANCSTLKERIDRKLLDIDRRIQELKDFKTSILHEVQKAKSDCGMIGNSKNCTSLSAKKS